MAEIITQKERKRRFWTIIICAILDVLAIGLGAYAMIESDKLKKNEQQQDEEGNPIITIETLTNDCIPFIENISALKDNQRSFSDPWGWVEYSADTQYRFTQSLLVNEAIKDYLDLWVPELPKLFLGKSDFSPYREWKIEKKKIRLEDGSEYEDEVGEWKPAQATKEQLVVTKLIEYATEEQRKLIADKEKLEGEIAASRRAETEAMGTIRKDHRDRVAMLPGPIDQYRRLMEEFSAKEKSNFEELHALEIQVAEKRRERDELIVRLAAERVAQEAKVDELKQRVRWMKQVVDYEEMKADPDGRIISVDLRDGLVRTTLTKESRVFNFMRFKVFSVEKGLQRMTKGEIEIIELHDTYSVGRIERMKDENPFKPGDFIWNARYDVKLPNHFILAGRLTRYSRSEIMHKVTEFGDVFQDKMDDKSQYCIVGLNYEEDPVYKEAVARGLRIYTEHHLYRYLGFPE